MAAVMAAVIVGLLCGCAPKDVADTEQEADEVPSPVALLEAAPLFTEFLSLTATSAAPTTPGAVVAWDDALTWLDARGEPVVMEGVTEGPVRAALPLEGETLLAVGDALYTWDGGLWESPLSALLDAPVEQLLPDGEDLWIQTDAIYRWRDGALTALTIDDRPVEGPIAVGGSADGVAVTWVGHNAQAIALDPDGAVVSWTDFPEVWQIAVDAGQNGWLNDGGSLWFRGPEDSDWARVGLGAAVTGLIADPLTAAVWINTTDGAYVGGASGLAPAALPEGEWQGIDDQGRLLIATAAGMARVTDARWVRWLDLPEVLEANTTVALEASTADDVSAVSWRLNGEDIALSGPPWTLTLSPTDARDGVVTLSASVDWESGERADLEDSLTVVVDEVTWKGHIEPLYQDFCAACHGGDAETILDSRDAWEASIDTILSQVESGAMPLASDPLSDTQLSWIHTWRDSGFP